jgi:hypothetical protein
MDTTTDQALVVDEFTIDPGKMPGTYVARLAIRFERDQFAAALSVAYAFVKTKYADVVVTGYSGSRNGDQVTVFFHSSGRKDAL